MNDLTKKYYDGKFFCYVHEESSLPAMSCNGTLCQDCCHCERDTCFGGSADGASLNFLKLYLEVKDQLTNSPDIDSGFLQYLTERRELLIKMDENSYSNHEKSYRQGQLHEIGAILRKLKYRHTEGTENEQS